jgi:hypothetical protein
MSVGQLDTVLEKLEYAEQQLEKCRLQVVKLRAQAEMLSQPSGLSDEHAKTILKDFLTRAQVEDEPWIAESPDKIKFYSLWLRGCPEWVCMHCNRDPRTYFSTNFTLARSRSREQIEPTSLVQRALHHFNIGWDLGECISDI